jgi:hypothetical protein
LVKMVHHLLIFARSLSIPFNMLYTRNIAIMGYYSTGRTRNE